MLEFIKEMEERRQTRKDWESVEGEGGRLLTTSENFHTRNMETEAQNVRFFTKLFTFTQILGILTIGLIVVWLSVFRGGFAWHSDPSLEFNWHPLFMVIGLVFLYANGALIYRAFRSEAKRKLKLMHATFHIGALIFAIIGLQAVFDSHNLNVGPDGEPKPMTNMYSLHSWVGISVVVLFACQWLMGLLTFLFPGLRPAIRSAYLPVHQFFGLAIFVGAVATTLLGLNEKAIFTLGPKYHEKGPEAILINCIGLCVIVFAGLVVYLTGNNLFKRKTTEDEILLTDTVLE